MNETLITRPKSQQLNSHILTHTRTLFSQYKRKHREEERRTIADSGLRREDAVRDRAAAAAIED